MAQSNRNAEARSYQTGWQFDSTAWSRQLDIETAGSFAAIKELSKTYQYASLRFGMATDFAEKLYELKSQGAAKDSSAHLEGLRQECGREIEAILDELSEALGNIISHG